MSGDVDRLQSLGMALANISIRMKVSVKKIEESLETIIKAMDLERERDEARAEVERLTVVCEEAGMQVGLLEREVEHLRRGIEAYRRAFEEFDAEYCPSDFLSPETLEAMRKWEVQSKRLSVSRNPGSHA